MANTCGYNCSSHPSEIQAYGDVAGIGVTLAFIITAWMIVSLLIGYYLAAYKPELDPFRRENEKTLCQYPNHVDYAFVSLARQLPGLSHIQDSKFLEYSKLESTLNSCVIIFADIQIFTGISILISGYIAITCGLSSYHWQLIVYLAWLACVTHLASLSFLRNYLTNSPQKRLWRVMLMLIMLVFLAVAVGPTGHFEWDGGSQKPADFAACYFHKPLDKGTVAFESMVKMILLLVYGFAIRLAKMSKAFEGWLRKTAASLRTYSTVHAWDPRAAKGLKRLKLVILDPFVIAFCCLVNIQLDLLASFLAEVYWLTFALIWGTKRLFYTRKLGPGEENEWTFGQTLPLVLILAPLAAVAEHFSHSPSPTERQQMARNPTVITFPSRPGFEEARAAQEAWETQKAREATLINIDLKLVNSISYRGAFCLAALAYIEAGIFFVVDDLKGISQPLRSHAFSFFLFNPALQILWIMCTTWVSKMNWIVPLKRSARGIAFLSLTLTSMAEFFGPSALAFEGIIYNAGHTLRDLIIAYATLVLVFETHYWLEGSWKVVRLLPALVPLHVTYLSSRDIDDSSDMIGPCFVTFGASLAWFVAELLVERKGMSLKIAVGLRCAFVTIALVPMLVSYYVEYMPGPLPANAWLVVSWMILSYFGLISIGMVISLFTPILLDRHGLVTQG